MPFDGYMFFDLTYYQHVPGASSLFSQFEQDCGYSVDNSAMHRHFMTLTLSVF